MKRIVLIIIAVLLVCASFSACGATQDNSATITSFPIANFNNNYWFAGDFWAFDDTVFYLQDGFYNMGVYWSVDGNNKKIFEESDFANVSSTHYLGDVFVCGNYLYFELNTDQGDWLYRYNLEEGTYAPVCRIPSLYRWVVVDNYFIYREFPSKSNEKRSALCIYNLMDSTTTQVCANVEEFGIVDGQLRYITNSDAYTLYQYNYLDNYSTILGTFYCEFDDSYDLFNFTPDAVLMLNWDKEYSHNLVVYSLSSNSTAVYTLPKGIHNMVAYDQYAYAVVYDTQKTSSVAVAAEENGIYRINLTDGSYEVVENNAGDNTEIHVVSDDCIYIIQRKMNILFQSRRHVYKFDYKTGSKEELTVM